jgi:hypothetical protein
MSAYTDLQSKFAFNLARFLLWLESQGYEVGLGESWRTDRQAQWNAENGKGIVNSLHRDRMAQDIVIRKNGVEVGLDDYKRCGDAWVAIDSMNAWGGNFQTLRDYQHFSQSFGGRS